MFKVFNILFDSPQCSHSCNNILCFHCKIVAFIFSLTTVPSPCEWNANSFCFVVGCPYTGLFSWEIWNFMQFSGVDIFNFFLTDQCTKILRLQKGPASGLLSAVLPQKLLQGCELHVFLSFGPWSISEAPYHNWV